MELVRHDNWTEYWCIRSYDPIPLRLNWFPSRMSWVRIPSPAPGANSPLAAYPAPDGAFVAELGSGSLIAEPTGSLTLDYQVPAGAALGNYGLQVIMSDKRRATSTDFVVVEDIFDVFTVVARPELAGFAGPI